MYLLILNKEEHLQKRQRSLWADGKNRGRKGIFFDKSSMYVVNEFQFIFLGHSSPSMEDNMDLCMFYILSKYESSFYNFCNFYRDVKRAPGPWAMRAEREPERRSYFLSLARFDT